MEKAVLGKKQIIKSVKYSYINLTLQLDGVPAVLGRLSLSKIEKITISFCLIWCRMTM